MPQNSPKKYILRLIEYGAKLNGIVEIVQCVIKFSQIRKHFTSSGQCLKLLYLVALLQCSVKVAKRCSMIAVVKKLGSSCDEFVGIPIRWRYFFGVLFDYNILLSHAGIDRTGCCLSCNRQTVFRWNNMPLK